MTSLRGLPAAAAISLLLLTTACAQIDGANDAAGAAEAAGSAAEAYPDDALVFRMGRTGGFLTPAVLATRLPVISVYGDGRVITQGPTTLVYPGPALPNLQVATISDAEVENLVTQALAAGVGTDQDLGTPSIADATSTRFTVRHATGVDELEVYALAEATDPATGLSADQLAARDKLRKFADSLTDGSGSLGGAAGAATQSYVPTTIAAAAEPWVDGGEDGAQPEVAWPGPKLPGEPLTKNLGLGCVTVTGAAAQKLIAAAASANAATPWISGGQRWSVALRPLLPDETDCTGPPHTSPRSAS